MRRFGVTLAVLTCLLTLVVGQGAGATPSIEQASVNLLQVAQVQTELKMTPAQRKSFESELRAFRAQGQQIFGKRPANEQERTAGLQRFQRLQMETGRKVLALLTAPQRARLRQLGLQLFGLFTLQSPEVAKEMSLTPAQRKTVTDAMAELNRKVEERGKSLESQRQASLRAVPEPKDAKDQKSVQTYQQRIRQMLTSYQAEDAKAFDGFRKQAEARIERSLSAAQRAKWQQMKGPKFQFPKGIVPGA